MAASYAEIVKALEEELDEVITSVCLSSLGFAFSCERCRRDDNQPLLHVFGPPYGGIFLCADRPACRARAKCRKEEREKAVEAAVILGN